MTTDTALGVTKMVIDDKSKLDRTDLSRRKAQLIFVSSTGQDSLRRTSHLPGITPANAVPSGISDYCFQSKRERRNAV
jgi:hypothetical protein